MRKNNNLTMNDATIQSIFEKSINIPEQTICIDGILTDVNGFQMLAERWNGSEIILMEIEPCEDEVNMLATWKGKEIRLDYRHMVMVYHGYILDCVIDLNIIKQKNINRRNMFQKTYFIILFFIILFYLIILKQLRYRKIIMNSIVIGVLHGCRQDSVVFQRLFKDYVNKFQNKLDVSFVFIDAQYPHEDDGKMWYKNQLHLNEIGVTNFPMEDIEHTINYIDNQIEMHHIQILIGFSQGGNVVSTYLKLRQNNQINLAIIMAGYDFPILSTVQVNIPTLYIGSDRDEIVPIKHIISGYSNLDIL